MTKNHNIGSQIKTYILGGLVLFVLLALPIFSVQAAPIEFNIAKEATYQKLPNASGTTSDPKNYKQNFASLLGDMLSIVMPVAAILLLLYLLLGAVEWITSGGDKGKLEKARQKMTSAVMGILVASAVVSIFMLMQQVLNICVFDFWGNGCGL